MRTWGRPASLFALILGVAALAPRTAAPDEEVARFLLEQAKKAISGRDFAEAARRLERAREEDPGLVEASYLLGTVHEKLQQPDKALAAYRAFRDACAARRLAGTLDKRMTPLVEKAEARIAALGKGEGELDAMNAAFAARGTAFAERAARDDPDIASFALRKVLAVAPEHAAARELLDRIERGADPAASDASVDPKTVPIRGIVAWSDLIRARAIPASKWISYTESALAIASEQGRVYWTDPVIEAPEVFVFEVEFRVAKVLAPGWLVGLAFGRDDAEEKRTGGSHFLSAILQKSQAVVMQASGDRDVDLAKSALGPVLPGTWHRLTLAVEKEKVRVLVDGKRVITTSVPGRDRLAGPVGVFHQDCEAEARILRLGTRR